ncbi:MAG TPA: DUF4230 domain-containing protein [Chloroflexia bacterium]|nr:DUF4230 domain-containing protein [Chloroflexia bacterium]
MGQDYRGSTGADNQDEDHLETHPRRPPSNADSTAPRVLGDPGGPGPRPAPQGGPLALRPAGPPPPPRPTPPPTVFVSSGPAAPGPALPSFARRNTGNACIWLLALGAIVILACALLGAGVLKDGLNGLTGMVPRFPSLTLLTPTVIIQPQGPAVVQQIQALSRIETAQYSIERVLTGESTGVLPFMDSDKILFIAHGDVIAGVDLSRLSDADVQVVSDTVTIRLPAAEILTHRLDNQKSRVYDRQTGFFRQADPNLETQIRQEAEKEITDAAVEDGILKTAQDNAEKTVRILLHSLHYDTVIFEPPLAPAPTNLATPDLSPAANPVTPTP